MNMTIINIRIYGHSILYISMRNISTFLSKISDRKVKILCKEIYNIENNLVSADLLELFSIMNEIKIYLAMFESGKIWSFSLDVCKINIKFTLKSLEK